MIEKFCFDCKYCSVSIEHDPWRRVYKCHKFSTMRNVVNGELLELDCEVERAPDGRCKPEGLLWEEKQPELPRYLDQYANKVDEKKPVSLFK